jgi:hypothetical protein
MLARWLSSGSVHSWVVKWSLDSTPNTEIQHEEAARWFVFPFLRYWKLFRRVIGHRQGESWKQ